MNNIIITPAIGMPPNDINLFLSSLRRFYKGEVLFFVGKNDHLLKKISSFMTLLILRLTLINMK